MPAANGQHDEVSAGNKAQADKEASALFQLVDLHGGGELVELAKEANRKRDFVALDRAIRDKVRPYLYNDGQFKLVSVAELVHVRRCYRQGKPLQPFRIDYVSGSRGRSIPSAWDDGAAARRRCCSSSSSSRRRKAPSVAGRSQQSPDVGPAGAVPVCWNLYKRGPVGETIVHLCLLQASSAHLLLVKRLLVVYPCLMLDIYASDQYYGESALHMAIVNEDPAMVRYLLDRAASHCLHGRRCCGEFFCAADQKRTRRDAVDGDWVLVSERTDYSGHAYFGEYPLSFAVSLGQEECVRILAAKGADLNAQDHNGNTAMHMAVIRGQVDMYELLLTLGAPQGVKNRQGLTPLALAAKLARKEMYDFIIARQRQIFWVYGGVVCAGYPLADLDSVSEDGSTNRNSVLDIVVRGSEPGHVDMVEAQVVCLLKEKWRTFVRFRFYRSCALFCTYFALFSAVMYLRSSLTGITAATTSLSQSDDAASVSNGSNSMEPSLCYGPSDLEGVRLAKSLMEIAMVVFSVSYLVLAGTELRQQGWSTFYTSLRYAPDKFLFHCSCAFVFCMVPCRLSCSVYWEDTLATLAMLCTAPYFLFFCRGIKAIGPFVLMIFKMVFGDMMRFGVIFMVFIVGFSQSMFIVFAGYGQLNRNGTTPFSTPTGAIMGMFYLATGQFTDIHQSLANSRHQRSGPLLFAVFLWLVVVLLINMLVAMMGNTFKLVSQAQKEWLRQWANIILVIEQSVSADERQRQRRNYSQPLSASDGQRALVVRERMRDTT